MPKTQVRPRVCVDMDEVIADTLGDHLERYNATHGTQIAKADLAGKWLWQVVEEEHLPKLEEILRAPLFFEELPVMPDSQRVLEAMCERYEVFIASAAMEVPTSFAAKFRWLGRHFPFIPTSHMVFCGTKSILRADFLIDDNPRQLKNFGRNGVLYSAPHNAYAEGYRRVENWLEMEELFLGGEVLRSF